MKRFHMYCFKILFSKIILRVTFIVDIIAVPLKSKIVL